ELMSNFQWVTHPGIALAPNSLNYGVPITLKSSNGGDEFLSKAFTNFLACKGIVRHLSGPYTLQQNGLAERKNRHIIETTITLLTAAALPGQFWFHSTAHAMYLINRMSSFVSHNQSPYFHLFGHHPDLASLRIFGTADPSTLAFDTPVSTSQSQSISSTHGSLSLIQHQASLDDTPVASAGSSDQLIQRVVTDLSEVFEMKDMGQPTFFLGLQISYNSSGDIFVSQTNRHTTTFYTLRDKENFVAQNT
ncbi:Tautomerase/MIF superfamily protein, partial [Prunus dulcis]